AAWERETPIWSAVTPRTATASATGTPLALRDIICSIRASTAFGFAVGPARPAPPRLHAAVAAGVRLAVRAAGATGPAGATGRATRRARAGTGRRARARS